MQSTKVVMTRLFPNKGKSAYLLEGRCSANFQVNSDAF